MFNVSLKFVGVHLNRTLFSLFQQSFYSIYSFSTFLHATSGPTMTVPSPFPIQGSRTRLDFCKHVCPAIFSRSKQRRAWYHQGGAGLRWKAPIQLWNCHWTLYPSLSNKGEFLFSTIFFWRMEVVITQRDDLPTAKKDFMRRRPEAERVIQIVRIEKTAMAEKIKSIELKNRNLQAKSESLKNVAGNRCLTAIHQVKEKHWYPSQSQSQIHWHCIHRVERISKLLFRWDLWALYIHCIWEEEVYSSGRYGKLSRGHGFS